MNKILLAIGLLTLSFVSLAQQGVGINTDNSNPDASAILDVKSIEKGILIPRMTTVQRTAILSPATGLLVFDNTSNSFWFYNGTTWTELGGGESPFQHSGVLVSPNTSIVNEATNDFVFGSTQLGDDGNANHDRRFFFDKSEGSFRAGMATGTEWNVIGRRSTAFGANTRATNNETMAFGNNTTASGPASTAWGNGTSATANYATAWGGNTTASGGNSTAFGFNTTANNNLATAFGNGTTASSRQSTAFGQNTTASADNATAMGLNTRAYSFAETVIGTNSTVYTPIARTSYNAADRIFTIGNGATTATPSDALVILKNGNTTLNGQLTLSDGVSPFTLPNADGMAGQVLSTDGAGNVSWAAAGGSDNQDLSLIGNTLSLTNDGTTVDLSAYLDADNLGNHTATTNLNMANFTANNVNRISMRNVVSYDKLRVWNDSRFTIGMNNAMSFGYLNDYAMTFTMNDAADRGWIWRDVADTKSDGAASLTTDGRFTVKSILRSNDQLIVGGTSTLTDLAGTGTRMVVADATGVLSTQAIPTGDITGVSAGAGLTGGGTTGALTVTAAANNGLNVDAAADRIQLGGALLENTTITAGNFNMVHNLNGSGSFHVQDAGVNHFSVGSGGDSHFGSDVYWRDNNTGGTILARLIDSGSDDDGLFDIYRNGAVQHRLNGNGATIINEQGIADGDFRVESDNNTHMIFADASASQVGIGVTTPLAKLHVGGFIRSDGLAGGGDQMVYVNNNGVLLAQALPTGDITGLTAGAGLTGGGTTGALMVTAAANNGLNVDAAADRIQLGGALTENTIITNGNFNMTYNLSGTGAFRVQDAGVNHFLIGSGGDASFGSDVYWRDENTGGTILARLIDSGSGDDGLFDVYRNGVVQHRLNGDGVVIINEQGASAGDFRVESDINTHMLFVDASANQVGIGVTTPLAKLHVGGFMRSDGLAGGGTRMVTVNNNGVLLAQSLTASTWGLTGNAGTTSGTNFIGTTDNVALDFRTNNVIKARLTTKGQIEILNTGQSVFLGQNAGRDDDLSTNRNTFIGHNTGLVNTTGLNNTALGNNALSTGATRQNTTALGYNTAITGNHQVRLGNSAVASIGGFAGWSNVSDARFKTNVQENVAGLDFINKLRPVTYNLDMDAIAKKLNTPDSLRIKEAETQKAAQLQTGFIAQEVEAAAKELGYDFSGVDAPKNEDDHYGLRYAEFTVPLVKAVQELSKENEELKAKIQKLEQMQTELDEIKALLETKASR
ncbi:MAG: hypothetical protein GY810_13940 [Aureispira sp.]|nr:hypothetical protein [Aureispira sp.]